MDEAAAYADNWSDRALLERVGQAVVVHPRPLLGWPATAAGTSSGPRRPPRSAAWTHLSLPRASSENVKPLLILAIIFPTRGLKVGLIFGEVRSTFLWIIRTQGEFEGLTSVHHAGGSD